MGINKESNAYTVIFATAMVVVVGGAFGICFNFTQASSRRQCQK